MELPPKPYHETFSDVPAICEYLDQVDQVAEEHFPRLRPQIDLEELGSDLYKRSLDIPPTLSQDEGMALIIERFGSPYLVLSDRQTLRGVTLARRMWLVLAPVALFMAVKAFMDMTSAGRSLFPWLVLCWMAGVGSGLSRQEFLAEGIIWRFARALFSPVIVGAVSVSAYIFRGFFLADAHNLPDPPNLPWGSGPTALMGAQLVVSAFFPLMVVVMGLMMGSFYRTGKEGLEIEWREALGEVSIASSDDATERSGSTGTQ